MPDKISVDLTVNPQLDPNAFKAASSNWKALEDVVRNITRSGFEGAIKGLHLGDTLAEAFKANPSTVSGIARNMGINLKAALNEVSKFGPIPGLRQTFSPGVSPDLQRKVQAVSLGLQHPTDYQRFISQTLGSFPSVSHGYKDASSVLAQKVNAVSAILSKPVDYSKIIGQTLGPNSTGQSAASSAAAFAKALGPVPPVIAKNLFARIEQMLGGRAGHGGGGLLSGFGRYEIGQAFVHAIGLGGGGVGGRVGGAALAGFGGKIPGLTVGLAALTVAVEGAKVALKHLVEAAEEGAKLYQQGRALGIGSANASAYLKTLGAVGVDEGTALQLAAFGQFRTGRAAGGGFRGNVAGEMISSGMRAGMSQLQLQQIANMAPEIDRAAKDLLIAIRATGIVAKENFETVYAWRVFKADFAAFWQEVAGLFGPILQDFIHLADVQVRIWEVMAGGMRQIQQAATVVATILGHLPGALGDFGRLGAALFGTHVETSAHRISGFARQTSFSSLERMGLVIGGHGNDVTGYLSRIANATEKIAASTPRSGPGFIERARNAVVGPGTDLILTDLFGAVMRGAMPTNIP